MDLDLQDKVHSLVAALVTAQIKLAMVAYAVDGIGRRGTGRGFRNGSGISPVRRQSWLENQISALQSAIQNLSDRLDSLNKE